MKFFCASLSHETSKFSPIPTSLDNFREEGLYLPFSGEGTAIGEMLEGSFNLAKGIRARGHEAIVGPVAFAQPGRPVDRATYEAIKCDILGSLQRAMPIDGVLMFLHGAQVAENVDDCEGDILAAVRAVVGPTIPIGVASDLHGNFTPAMLRNADLVLPCLEYPHTDFDSRAEKLIDLIVKCVRREIRPVFAHRRVPMLGTYYTTASPMREFVDWAKSFEDQDGILGVGVTHGFAWSDIEACGASVMVHTDGDEALAARTAERIAERYFQLRQEIRNPYVSVNEAVSEALAHDGRPVVIADITDNPGGGAAGDSTFLLRALLAANLQDALVGMLWDPAAAELASRAGVGARLPLRVGGKAGPASGAPLDVDATVLACRDDATQMAQGSLAPLGRSVLVQAGGIRIVLNSIRQQVFDPACFEAFGADPRTASIVVVKSQQHFHETFHPFASKIIYASPPGTVNMDYRNVDLRNVPRPMFPIDQPPFSAFGRTWSP